MPMPKSGNQDKRPDARKLPIKKGQACLSASINGLSTPKHSRTKVNRSGAIDVEESNRRAEIEPQTVIEYALFYGGILLAGGVLRTEQVNRTPPLAESAITSLDESADFPT